MKTSIRLFRIAGFDIGVHYSWFFVLLIITWSLAQGYFPQSYPNWAEPIYWIAGVLAALTLFVSVLLHELAHSVVARSRGMSVNSITLFIFGGVSNLQEEPKRPGTEFIMSIVGPLTSLALSGIFWGLAKVLEPGSIAEAIAGYLTLVNLILAIFNLLPGFPLDGGRVLRSIVWASTGSLSRATNVAAFTGQLFGWALIIYGFLQLLAGNFIGGVWTAFIGWFLNNAADASRREVHNQEQFSNITVKEVMSRNIETITSDASVEEAVAGILSGRYGRAVPVAEKNELIGIVTITDIKGLPKEKWASTRVHQLMTRGPLHTVTPEDNIGTALELLAKHDINQVVVSQQGQLLGMLKRADIINYLQLSRELG